MTMGSDCNLSIPKLLIFHPSFLPRHRHPGLELSRSDNLARAQTMPVGHEYGQPGGFDRTKAQEDGHGNRERESRGKPERS